MNPDQMPVNENRQCDINCAYITKGLISIHFNDKTFVLEPKEDLTAYELWNINILIEEMKLNKFLNENIGEKIYNRACELKIDRHFKQKN